MKQYYTTLCAQTYCCIVASWFQQARFFQDTADRMKGISDRLKSNQVLTAVIVFR